MKVFSKRDIDIMIEKSQTHLLKEELELFVGEDDDRRLVIKAGLKIIHMPTGIVYTVSQVDLTDFKNPMLFCARPGREIIITSEDFNEYERQ
jgi:hypothetical protein